MWERPARAVGRKIFLVIYLCLLLMSIFQTVEGYGFTSADDLEEVDIGPGDKPRPTFISKKLDPILREQMIALLKEGFRRASAPAQEGISAISATSTPDEGRSPRGG